MKLNNKNIVITAGGTGGHIFPALAVAQELSIHGANITWVGNKDSMEDRLISGKFDMEFINASGVRGKGLKQKLLFPYKLFKNIYLSIKVLRKLKADLVIGFGGYVSGSACIAAKILNIPIMIHEQNAVMGMTNRYLSKIASKVFLGFDIVKNKPKYIYVGNPIRTSIVNLKSINKKFYKDSLNIFVLGGSQGAKYINETVPDAFISLINKGLNINICHQTGAYTYQKTIERYDNLASSNNIEIVDFITDIDKKYSWADLIICRSGALSVSEVSASGIPAIFIPFPAAVDDHQYYNAKALVKHDAAYCIRENEISSSVLEEIIENLYNDRDKLCKMSEKAKQALKYNASELISNEVYKILNKG